MKRLLYVCLILLTTVSCSKDNDANVAPPPVEWGSDLPSVTVIYSISGPGDNGYNDLAVTSIAQLADRTDVDFHTLKPKTMEEARVQFAGWLEASAKRSHKSLLILAGNDYEDFARICPPLDSMRTVLVAESSIEGLAEGVCTANIDRRGSMYLAGALCSRTAAYIMAATPNDKMVAEAVNAFRRGYERYSGGLPLAPVFYLAEGWDGYLKPYDSFAFASARLDNHLNAAYETGDFLAARHIIVPMAGFSNTGVYYHAIQNNSGMPSCQAVVGMDVNYNDRVDMAPFSVEIRMDMLLADNIKRWFNGERLPAHHTYTMAEGYTDVVLNPGFNTGSIYCLDEVELPEEEGGGTTFAPLPLSYWQEKYETYRQEALEQ